MVRVLALAVVVAVLSVLVWWFALVQPARQQEAALRTEAQQLTSETSTLQTRLDQLLALRDQAPDVRVQLDRLSGLIPPDADQARLLGLVQSAANASGTAFTSIAFSEAEVVEGAPPLSDPGVVLGATTVTGSMRATYFQLVDFLRRLEVGSSRAILVTAVGLAEGPAGFPQLDTTFSATIYSLIPAPVVEDPTVPGLTEPVLPEDAAGAAPTPTPGAQSPATPVPTATPSPAP